ncbi:gephyrin-like molybdotransferase Glp [Alteromonas sp. C1M14]|uniref:molybdopterin molybdotransferase MoeA n=1 Tax=Alteromonas sp. C1M14 TaxID=2841567 RepID=UPI001C08AE84|nr:gephyrin-like molybdotransferase Glp [Alteromonas sp. C1M14]MBU2976773.1 molybdopterin molybdotransferase MoeA [Alteromonas sp. C1M14]
MTNTFASNWLSLDAALQHAYASLTPVTESITLSIDAALGHVTAEDIVAPVDVPPADNSAMDGYALYASDTHLSTPLPVIGSQFAGMPKAEDTLQKGTALRIMTGALIPAGADCVVMQENTTANHDTITVNKPALVGENIRRAGSDIRANTSVIPKGTLLAASHLVLLASMGIHQVLVNRPLKVGLMATGDELKEAGESLSCGQIYESNRTGTRALLAHLPVDITDYGIIPDDKKALEQVLSQAAKDQDLLISSGGVSVGDADYVKDIVQSLGKINFWKIAIKPGKPFAFGRLGDCVFCGVPGNPVSAFVTTQQIVLPIIKKMIAIACSKPLRQLTLSATLAKPVSRKPGREEFVRAVLTQHDDGEYVVHPLAKQSSGVMTTVTQANSYLIIPAEVAALEEGAKVTVQPFSLFPFVE